MADTERPASQEATPSPAAAASMPRAAIDHGAMGDKPSTKPSTSQKRPATSRPRKAPAVPGEHPKYSVMIADAIAKLKERGGSSRQAISKFITSHYRVGVEINKINARIKLSLRAGVKSGALKQSKGTGASGSFRLGDRKRAEKALKASSSVKRATSSKTTKSKPAVRKAKSPAKRASGASKKTKGRSPAKKATKTGKKLKTTPKKVKTAASKAKARTKSPAKKSVKQKTTKKSASRR